MKWYFASRMRHKEKINSIVRTLSNYGHEASFDWTDLGSIKPYYKNKELCAKFSYGISKGIKDSDVFVMISDREGTDMFTEKGIAISSNMDKGTPRIYVVGKYNQRSMMHFHPSVNRVNSIEDVFEKEFSKILEGDFSLPAFD